MHEQGGVAAHPALNPPHILDLPNRCGLCHSMDGAPGGMLTSAGQENLCQSCHSAGKIAGKDWIGPGDTYMNHPWGVPAANADPGPAPGSEVALHLDAGKVRCGTCHDPHESSQGTCETPSPIPGWPFPIHIGSCTGGSANGEPCQSDAQCEMMYMRTEGRKINLCGECHVQYDEWLHAGHSEEHADPWSHYDWSMGNNWLCTGPGTPYAYCTDVGAGTAASPAAAVCTGAGTPLACCTGAGTGPTCFLNGSCTGAATPWPCCTGVGTGTCPTTPSLSIAACTGPGTPMTCCTGVRTGSCSSREACRQCHSGNGYVDFSNDFPDGTVNTATHRGAFRVADCLVCHTTHGKSHDEHLLRIYDTVRLPTGQMITGAGPGATCMACHNGRIAPPTQNTTTSLSTPHYLLGGVML
ncbi:MAG: cytochrome c3 family protein, partial [Planctomycetota bacterium]